MIIACIQINVQLSSMSMYYSSLTRFIRCINIHNLRKINAIQLLNAIVQLLNLRGSVQKQCTSYLHIFSKHMRMQSTDRSPRLSLTHLQQETIIGRAKLVASNSVHIQNEDL